jgi:prepilin-type N-terminal cleavage/methylation domain-containing protein
MHKRKGQTLVELLVAMFVIAVGLFAAVGVVYSNLALVDRDTDEVIAVNLAREGAELAKETRDSNWLAGNTFDTGLAQGTDYTATPVWDGSGTTPVFDFSIGDISGTDSIVVQVTSTSPGFYANLYAPTITGMSTSFRRLLTFHPICSDQSVLNDGVACSGGLTKIGIRVESHVQWVRKGVTKDFTIYEDLYDWR